MKKRLISIFAVLCIVVTVFPVSAFALTDDDYYDKVGSCFIGWCTYKAYQYSNQAIGSKTLIGGVDNRNRPTKATYDRTHKIALSMSCTSALKSEIGSSLNFKTGAVNGGLGAKIQAEYSVTSGFVSEVTERYTTTVKAGENFKLYSQPYGLKTKVYAIYHSAWIHTTKVNGIISTPQCQVFVPVTSVKSEFVCKLL